MKSRRTLSLLFGTVFLLAVATVAEAALEAPPLRGRVQDDAGLLTPEATRQIEQKLAAFEERTGAQVAVLTLPSLAGEDLEELSHRIAESWQLGRQGHDDGVLFLVALAERKMRIEVGYGLEDKLTDLEAGDILDRIVKPRMRSGDTAGGIEQGVDAILATLDGLDVIPPRPTAGDLDSAPLPARLGMLAFVLVILSVFSVSALFSSGCGSWFLYLFLLPFYAVFPGALLGPVVGGLFTLGWLLGFPIAKRWLTTSGGKTFRHRYPRFDTFAASGAWGSSRGGGWGGGGGFSGGGGSFGGGGASSSW